MVKEEDILMIVFFDGECNLCNESVQFILKHDKKELFHFASLQSDVAQKYIPKLAKDLNSIVLYTKEKVYTKSDAILHIGYHLGNKWRIPFLMIGIPSFIRNGAYNLVAKKRYRWFGKLNTCMVPKPEYKARFL